MMTENRNPGVGAITYTAAVWLVGLALLLAVSPGDATLVWSLIWKTAAVLFCLAGALYVMVAGLDDAPDGLTSPVAVAVKTSDYPLGPRDRD